jgi:hypothetical protein
VKALQLQEQALDQQTWHSKRQHYLDRSERLSLQLEYGLAKTKAKL